MVATPLANPTTSNGTQIITNVMTVAKIAAGRTQPGATNWQAYGSDGIYVDVDTTAAQFTKTPIYETSIGGDSGHWATTGASSVYSATATGFRIYIRWANGGALTPAKANGSKWYINWIGIEPWLADGQGISTQAPSTATQAVPSPKVVIYTAADFQGSKQELDVGSYDYNAMVAGLGNDTLSSLKVPPGYKVTLYEANFSGRSKTFTSDTSFVGSDFNDLTSSIKVEKI